MKKQDCGNTGCTADSCPAGECGDAAPKSMLEKTHELNNITKVIGVISGKGGVGKSLVTSMLAVSMRRKGYKVGVLDADITGPSIPRMFGVSRKATGGEFGIYPELTDNGIKIMSINLLLDDEESPVIWRGPLIGNMVKQFWTDVLWGDLDFLFFDMPPGTGDVPLTVFQSVPVNGIVVVTSPQDLVSMIVKKAYNMANTMHIPVLGIVENMSWIECPDCGKRIPMYGTSRLDEIAEELGLPVMGRMPIRPELADLCDKGEIEKFDNDDLADAAERLEVFLQQSMDTEADADQMTDIRL